MSKTKGILRLVIFAIAALQLVLVPRTLHTSARIKVEQEAKSSLILRAARMLDVESGRIVQPAVIVIEGDRIRGINPATLPQAQTVDLGDVTLLPGLMDMHTHLLLDNQGDDWPYREVTETPGDSALRGVRHAKETLLAGFTTVRDLGCGSFADVSLMRAIDKGWVDGPQMFPAGPALSITGGHGDVTGYAPGIREMGPEEGIANGVTEVLKAVRYQAKHGVKVIKIAATAGVISYNPEPGAQQYSEEEMRAAVEEAARHGLKVAAHAHGTEGIIAGTRAGVASIEHGSLLTEEAIALMKKNGTYLVPTNALFDIVDINSLPPVMRAKHLKMAPLAKEGLRRAIRAGVKIAFGSDSWAFQGQNAKEFTALVERGMTPIDAIRAATINAADLLGVSDRGRIAPGLLADLVGVPGNPPDNIRVLEDVQFVMKGGKIYKRP
jgi:imidazolonepropionase-like amidohydrolase